MISKRQYPHLYEFFKLGGRTTFEGICYHEKYNKQIFEESQDRYFIRECRDEIGGDKNIHMPEINHNPPPPFL